MTALPNIAGYDFFAQAREKYSQSVAIDAAVEAVAADINKAFTKDALEEAGTWLSQATVPSMTNQGQTQQEPLCDAVGELCSGNYEGVNVCLFDVLRYSNCVLVQRLREKLAAEWIDLHAENVGAAES